MKKIILITFLLFTPITPLLAQQDKFITDFIERLENSRKYLNLVAEMMPEEHYNYKVTEESLSFSENLMHIGFALDWHSQSLLGDREPRVYQTDTVFKSADKTKVEMMARINQTFIEAIALMEQFNADNLDDELDYFGINRSKRQIFMLLADHITHHRGQMLVSMRLKGITPPRYVLYQ
ncbi:DinB family protein [Maribacter hydrothermalis]|uniref:Damage-inducible protein DinB n=1 Tax=Maribacter hydrothermalis TaxID=1836467 RepID=A0A1B7YXN8_9FLAO|nr:DinB family protein [Maribacter hydrothermalis]APQ16827.1 damage-inducible protein DinB [Maribacter hydrothermalis]OBR35255.1 damage-inducible protein DinB [Maribacter hydrothermalis]